MKIAFVTTEFVSEGEFGGGLATYLNNITSILFDAGHSVTVITLSGSDESINWKGITVERVRVKKGRYGKRHPWIWALLLSYNLNRRLRYLAKSNGGFDVVQYANYYALAFFRTRIPSVVRLSSDSLLWRNGNKEDFDVSKEYRCENGLDHLEDMALKRADAVFGPSRIIADLVSRRTGKHINVVESPFIQSAQLNYLSPYFETVKEKRFLLTFGQLSNIKGIKTIGEVIYQILDKHKDLFYVFAGTSHTVTANGKAYTAIEFLSICAKEHADRIIYFGCLSRDHLYPIISKAEVVILPSRIDNLPNTCIEAMHLGRIVIGTNKASYEQLIDDGNNGYLINRDDSAGLLKTVERALNLSENERNTMGLSAMNRIEKMSSENVLKETIEQYRIAMKNDS